MQFCSNLFWNLLGISLRKRKTFLGGGKLDRALFHTVYPKKYGHGFCFAVLCCGRHWLIFPYPSGLLHWHDGNLTIAPVPAKQPWWIWINTSGEFIMNDCITTTKQSTTKTVCTFLGIYCTFQSSFPLDSSYSVKHYWSIRVITTDNTPKKPTYWQNVWGKPMLYIWHSLYNHSNHQDQIVCMFHGIFWMSSDILQQAFCIKKITR